MDFSNATLLGSNWKNNFLNDTLRFNSTQTLTIEGLVLNLTNSDGVSGILSGVALLESGARNWDIITINGYNFGSGIIESFTFPEGRDVQTKAYTATIKIPQSGDMSSLVNSPNYTGISYNYLQYLNGFTESSNLDRGIQKETYSQNVRFNLKGPYTLSGVTAAKAVAQTFFANNYLNSVVGTLYSGNSIKNFYTESYETQNNTFEFARTFDISTAENPTYSLWRSHTLDFDSAGISKITEKADYLGHTTFPFVTVSAQASGDMSGAYARCTGFFSPYAQNGEATLKSQPLTKSTVTNPFAGTLSYTMVFSNAFNIQSNGFWDYSVDIDQTQGGIYMAEEKGSIIGFGHIIDPKYSNAVSLWNIVKTGISGRISNSVYYRGYSGGYSPLPFPALRLTSRSTVFNKVQGKIDYTTKYSDQDSILSSTYIRKANVTISKEYDRSLTTSFNIPGNKEIAQIQPNLLPNVLNYSVRLNGQMTGYMIASDINTYLKAASGYLPAVGTGNNSQFLSSLDYSYDPFARNFNLTAAITTLPSDQTNIEITSLL